MGVYNNSDWLLNQIRGTANVVIKAFKFETLDIDWGQVGDDQGQTVDGNDYIDDLLIQEKYDQATAFIHSQLKRLTTIDYNLLVSIYIEYLENLSPVIRQKHHFDNRQLASLREKLSEFLW